MDLTKPLYTPPTPGEPEVRKALPENSPDWIWRAIHILSLVAKYGSLVSYVAFHLPGKWAALIFAGASATKDVAILIADYLDNGKKDDSFKPAE